MITPDDVRRAARLTRLTLDDAEADRLVHDLRGILDRIEALRSLDLRGVAPFSSAAEITVQLREDRPGSDPLAIPPADLAPAWRDGFFAVPRLHAPPPDA